MSSAIWDNLFRRTRKEHNLRLLLQSTILFRGLSIWELKAIENMVHHRSFQTGEMIFRQGDLGAGMYIIASGKVEIFTERTLLRAGDTFEKKIVSELGVGDFFGDLALVEEQGLRTASALALEHCKLIGFFKPDLLELTQRNPRVGVKILLNLGEVLGTRLKELTNELTASKTAKN